MFFEIMGDSVSSKALSPVANVDLTDSDGLKAGVRIFSELEVTLTGDLPCAFGPRFDIYAARIAFDEKEGCEVLVKIPRFSTCDNRYADASITKVCSINQAIHMGVMECYGRPALVMKLFRHGNLSNYIQKQRLCDTTEEAKLAILRLVVDVAGDLKAHHECHIVHGSLTTRNVLINDADQAIVSDYGSKAIFPTEYEGVPTDWPNEAPEVVGGETHTKRSDAYRFATTVLEMYRGAPLRMPFCARLLHQHLSGQYNYERPANMDQEIFDIIIKATVLDGNNRPSLEEMEHDLRLVWNSKKR